MSRWLRGRCVVDRVAALAFAIVISPVVAVCAALVRRFDGGPPLISVERVGRGGRVFPMWKLRSMRADGPNGRAGGLTLSGAVDDRITPVGKRLRGSHLDELPQLWNVVTGDMSLLGPRPEAPEWVDVDDPLWQRVLSVPPGMAGPTQLIVGEWEQQLISSDDDGSAYRTEVVPVKLAIDSWYVGSSSPFTDALVALTLVRRFLPGAEARTLRKRVFAEVPEARVVEAWLADRSQVPTEAPDRAATVVRSVDRSAAPPLDL